MASAKERRRLIVTADDFGRSRSINQAVAEAHRNGILSCASLMVSGEGFDEAVEIAKANPRLGVGLHLTLCCGKATAPAGQIPDLVNEDGTLPQSAVAAGFAYYFSRGLREQLRTEIEAQFQKFEESGLPCDHVNGHLHMHMHPAVFSLVLEEAKRRGVRAMRLTRPVELEWRLGNGRWIYRSSHWRIFRGLAERMGRRLETEGIQHTRQVFGLLEDSRVNENFLSKLLEELPPGESELYSHPSLDEFRHEYEALMSERVKRMVEERKIELICYRDI
jgi:hopanoid biosynthesis associated protein HpnK